LILDLSNIDGLNCQPFDEIDSVLGLCFPLGLFEIKDTPVKGSNRKNIKNINNLFKSFCINSALFLFKFFNLE